MIGTSMMHHIMRHLRLSFGLFVRVPAELPTVVGGVGATFDTPAASYLTTIVRQAADNPVIAAANAIRASQGGTVDWSWARQAQLNDMGVYLPGNDLDRWMQHGYISDSFAN